MKDICIIQEQYYGDLFIINCILIKHVFSIIKLHVRFWKERVIFLW